MKIILKFVVYFSIALLAHDKVIAFADTNKSMQKYHMDAGASKFIEFNYPSRLDAEPWEDGMNDGYIVFRPKKWKEVEVPYHEEDNSMRIDIALKDSKNNLDHIINTGGGKCGTGDAKEISGSNWAGVLQIESCEASSAGGSNCMGSCANILIKNSDKTITIGIEVAPGGLEKKEVDELIKSFRFIGKESAS